MKKLKLSLATFAFVLGIAAAFAFKPAETTTETSTFYWFDPSVSTYMGANALVDEEAQTGCDQTKPIDCEKGYRSDQLINASNPAQGVQPSQVQSPEVVILTEE